MKPEKTYKNLIVEYLNQHEKATIDAIYEFIKNAKTTGTTGKKYLREVVTNRYKGSDIFIYENPYVMLKKANPSHNSNPELREGNTYETEILQKARNKKVVKLVKERDKYTCQVCGFRYENNIVQAHHLIPLSTMSEEYQVKEEHLITLCPNCHSIAHILLREDDKYQKRELLTAQIKTIIKDKYPNLPNP